MTNVSIIMSTYNSARFVRESIESIQRQTYRDWELVITDDCSRDDTLAILHELAAGDERIKVIELPSNSGAGVARNTSINAAQGRYIAFCDSDDLWLPTKLEKQLRFMESNDVQLCFSPYYTCDEQGQYLAYVSAPRRVSLNTMRRDNKIGFLTCIYDAEKLGTQHIPALRKRKDWAMWLQLLKRCHRAYSVPEPLAQYRIHLGSLSSSKVGLVKYNARVYNEVFGWGRVRSYTYLFLVFLPCYLYKKAANAFINAWRTLV